MSLTRKSYTVFTTFFLCQITLQNPSSYKIFNNEKVATATKGTDWPFIVGVTQDVILNCAGSLIKNNWVLTAAHCWNTLLDFARAGIVFGIGRGRYKHIKDVFNETIIEKHHLQSCANGYVVTVPREYIIRAVRHVHDEYVEIMAAQDGMKPSKHDIALLKIEISLDFSHDKLAPLAMYVPKTDEMCKVIGWGVTTFSRHPNKNDEILNEANLKIISEKTFRNKISVLMYQNPYKNYVNDLISDKILTESEDSETHGYSGGPLVCNGIIFGIATAAISKPYISYHYNIFTHVGKYADWINGKVSPVKPRRLSGVNKNGSKVVGQFAGFKIIPGKSKTDQSKLYKYLYLIILITLKFY